jgi:asparagine synthase (glutamine-hydrolysing)
MCGISGAINFKLPYAQIGRLMHHRGPDEQNGFSVDNVDLYHLRLSILDIGGGKQPMHLHNRYTIVFNGEIYNHTEIREAHRLVGSTNSDTETLLLLYEKYGTAFLQHLDGMFAFAIYDHAEKKMFIARDRSGKKPLYYFHDGQKLVFASELNTLRALLPLQKNDRALLQYLRLGSCFGKSTPYLGVEELTAGSYLLIDSRTLQVQKERWWRVTDFYRNPVADNFEEASEKVDTLLHTAVKRRLLSSDLEVGCFLSGGIDSGLVTAVASAYRSSLKTFTVSFEGAYDEAPLARLVADKYGTTHTEIRISFDKLADEVVGILCRYGEPFFDSSCIPSFYVSREARKHLTVVLNGDGADELFGGYRRYVPFSRYDFFSSSAVVRKSAQLLHYLLPAAHEKKNSYTHLTRLAALAARSGTGLYLSAGVDIFEGYTGELLIPEPDYMSDIDAEIGALAGSGLSGLQKIMAMDFNINLFNDLLVKMDIATMAHSLEGRSPFLCRELLEYVPRISDRYKIDGATTKHLLRKLAGRYLPPELVGQPKRGFEIPLKNWVNGQLRQPIADYLGSPNACHRDYLKPGFVDRLLHRPGAIPAEKRAKMLWTLFSLECWYRHVCLDDPARLYEAPKPFKA